MSHYNKQNPFFGRIKDRFALTKQGSKKNTQHVVIDLSGSDLKYQVGDSIGIYPHYDDFIISKTLEALKMTGNEKIVPKQGGDPVTVYSYFKYKVSLSDVSQKLLKEVFYRQNNSEKKAIIEHLLKDENHVELKNYLKEHEVWDFLFAHQEVVFTPQEICDLLMPMMPRFYSIASSQNQVGDEVHLTVAPLEYHSKGYLRRGVATHFLCSLAPHNEPVIPLFIQPTHSFRLPDNHDTPIIMIGPGTGIAPFRAFMQERIHHHSKGHHWLFFGEWNRDYDYFYEEDWNGWVGKGHLRIETAFSRDQDQKVYVQHKMEEHGKELYQWLEKGAYLFVCGNADRMAKDVEASLLTIIQIHGNKDLPQARDYVKKLRQQKRYLRDVY